MREAERWDVDIKERWATQLWHFTWNSEGGWWVVAALQDLKCYGVDSRNSYDKCAWIVGA